MSKTEILNAIGQGGSMYALQCVDNGTTLYMVNLDDYVGLVTEVPKTYYSADSWDYDYSKLFHIKRDGNNFTMYYPSESAEQYLLKKSDFRRVQITQQEIAYYPVVRYGSWYYIETDSSATPCTFTLNDDMTISEGGKVLSLSGSFWHSSTRWLNNEATYTLTVNGAVGTSTTIRMTGWDEEPVYVSDGGVMARVARDVSYNYMGDMLFTPNEQKVVDRLTTAFADVLKNRDTNKDSKLDKAELLELVKANKCEVPELSVHKLLGELDIDNDGKISAADIKKYQVIQKNKLILEFNKYYNGLFKQFDTNKDGKLSLSELKKHAVNGKLPNAIQTLGKVFKLLDVNKSGFVEAKEFVTPPIALVKKFQTDFAAVLKKYDTKTVDGKIGKAELTQMAKDEGVKDVDAIVLAIFESYDKNGTGFLELSDFQKAK